MSAFKSSIISTLNALKVTFPDLTTVVVEELLNMVNNRYQTRTIWPAPQVFQGMLFNEFVAQLPAFVAGLKKYTFWTDWIDRAKFGRQTTTNQTSSDRYTSETTDRETGQNEKTTSDSVTNNETITDKFTSEYTDRETGELTKSGNDKTVKNHTTNDDLTSKTIDSSTSENRKATNETNNGSNSSTAIDMEGSTPLVGANDVLNESISAYAKNINKTSGTTNNTITGSATDNKTTSGTATKTDTLNRSFDGTDTVTTSGTESKTDSLTHSQTDNNSRTANGTETSNGSATDNYSSNSTTNVSDTRNGTQETNKNTLDWQESIREISQNEIWKIETDKLVSSLEYLFVGVSYYGF